MTCIIDFRKFTSHHILLQIYRKLLHMSLTSSYAHFIKRKIVSFTNCATIIIIQWAWLIMFIWVLANIVLKRSGKIIVATKKADRMVFAHFGYMIFPFLFVITTYQFHFGKIRFNFEMHVGKIYSMTQQVGIQIESNVSSITGRDRQFLDNASQLCFSEHFSIVVQWSQ